MNSFPPRNIKLGEIVLQIPGILKIIAIRNHYNHSANTYQTLKASLPLYEYISCSEMDLFFCILMIFY